MKKLLGILLAALFLVLPLAGDWYWNKYTGKLDYYVGGSVSPFQSLYLWDTNQSNKLIMSWYENDVANRSLYFLVNGGNRQINLSGNFILSGNNQVANWTITNTLELTSLARNLKTWWDYCEFTNAISPGNIYYSTSSGTGSSASPIPVGTSSRIGMWGYNTGTLNTGYALVRSSWIAFQFSGGIYTFETDIQLPVLSTAAEKYAIRIGFGDSTTGGEHTDGAYFYYSDAGANPNWYRNTANNTVLTSTDTGVAATVNWTRLKIVVNAAGTAVEFFIDGVSVGTNTTNIPTGVGRECGVVLSILKSNGTTARLLYIDWTWLHIDLTTSR